MANAIEPRFYDNHTRQEAKSRRQLYTALAVLGGLVVGAGIATLRLQGKRIWSVPIAAGAAVTLLGLCGYWRWRPAVALERTAPNWPDAHQHDPRDAVWAGALTEAELPECRAQKFDRLLELARSDPPQDEATWDRFMRFSQTVRNTYQIPSQLFGQVANLRWRQLDPQQRCSLELATLVRLNLRTRHLFDRLWGFYQDAIPREPDAQLALISHMAAIPALRDHLQNQATAGFIRDLWWHFGPPLPMALRLGQALADNPPWYEDRANALREFLFQLIVDDVVTWWRRDPPEVPDNTVALRIVAWRLLLPQLPYARVIQLLSEVREPHRPIECIDALLRAAPAEDHRHLLNHVSYYLVTRPSARQAARDGGLIPLLEQCGMDAQTLEILRR